MSFAASDKQSRPLLSRARTSTLAHDHVVFHMSSGAIVTFNDPRRFGSMKLVAREKLDAEPLLKGLGPEPLGNAFDAAMLARACKGKKTSLKAALLDQRSSPGSATSMSARRCIARAFRPSAWPRRSPTEPARRTSAPNGWSRPSRRCSTRRSRPAARRCAITGRTDGDLGMFQHNFRVYDREGEACRTPGCRGTVKRIVQNGRSTFYCPACQK